VINFLIVNVSITVEIFKIFEQRPNNEQIRRFKRL